MSDHVSRQSEYLDAVPLMSKSVVQRVFAGKASPRQAIKAKCLACCNWQREEITACAIAICPLWTYRPFQKRPETVRDRFPGGVSDDTASP